MDEAIIIGGGPSALSAALYLGRFERKTTLICDSFGGQAAIAGELENYPGFLNISGAQLVAKMVEQVKNLPSIKIITAEHATSVSKESEGFTVKTNKGEYKAKTLLISTGRSPRKLGLNGENELIGKGLSYCAVCDGPFARNKEVIIIGGGYAATEAALILEKLASKIVILNIGDKLSGETVVIHKVMQNKKIEVVSNAQTTDFILSEGKIAGIKYKDTKAGESKEVKGEFVFVEIGQVPNSKEFEGIVEINKEGEIVADLTTKMTSVAGIFASGDIASQSTKQVIAAAGDGAKAAISINSFLQNN